uniref:Uncharacterized protein n=1 Tax=Cacopsylla melanoneura TaxID=428564 RepID=A0A8D8T848_9HEMI
MDGRKNALFSVDEARYNRIPCGKGKKQHLVKAFEKTELHRKNKRACIEEERYNDELEHKEYFVKEARLCTFAEQELKERLIDGPKRLQPRLETDLIDLNDFPSQQRVKQLEENIRETQRDRAHWQRKRVFYENKIEKLKQEMKTLKPLDWNLTAQKTEREKYVAQKEYDRVMHEEALLVSNIKQIQSKKQYVREELKRKNRVLKQLMNVEAEDHNKLAGLIEENNCLKKIRLEKLKAIIEVHRRFDDKELEIAKEVLDMKNELDDISPTTMILFLKVLKEREARMIKETKTEEERKKRVEKKKKKIEYKNREEMKRFHEYRKQREEIKRKELKEYSDRKENEDRAKEREEKKNRKCRKKVKTETEGEEQSEEIEHVLSTMKTKEKRENSSKRHANSEATTQKPVEKWAENYKSTMALACKLKDRVPYDKSWSKIGLSGLPNPDTSDPELRFKRRVILCDNEPKLRESDKPATLRDHVEETQDVYDPDKVYKHPYKVYQDILDLQEEHARLTNMLRQQEASKPFEGIPKKRTMAVRVKNMEKKMVEKGVETLEKKWEKRVPLLREGTRVLKTALDEFLKMRRESDEHFQMAANAITRLFICISSKQDICNTMTELEDRRKVVKQFGKDVRSVNDVTAVPTVLKNIDVRLLPYLMKMQRDHKVAKLEREKGIELIRHNTDWKHKGMGCYCVKK